MAARLAARGRAAAARAAAAKVAAAKAAVAKAVAKAVARVDEERLVATAAREVAKHRA